jgi:hypothetical protein
VRRRAGRWTSRWQAEKGEQIITERVRGSLIIPGRDLLTIKRARPEMAPYWVL